MNQDEMSNLYRGSSKDASYQVSIHLAKRSNKTEEEIHEKLFFGTLTLMEIKKSNFWTTFKPFFISHCQKQCEL
jgi:hypothetical protein